MNIILNSIVALTLIIAPTRSFTVETVTPTPNQVYVVSGVVQPATEPITDLKRYLKTKADRTGKVCGYLTKKPCRTVNIADQLSVIIHNEGGWDNPDDQCNVQFGCGSGKGKIQLIESTRKHCEKMLGRPIDAGDGKDSIDCGIYLLEQEGIQHWEKWSGPY